MSVRIMGQVWEKDLPFNKAWVLMAMADHADHEGKNVFPSLALIAWKTGYALSSVKRIVADLRDDGILLPYGHTPGGVVIYRIQMEHLPEKPPFTEPESGRPKGRFDRTPRKTPSQIDTGFSDTHNRQFSISNSKRVEVTVTNTRSNSSYYRDEPDFSDYDESLFDRESTNKETSR